jgi:hypothetical protein
VNEVSCHEFTMNGEDRVFGCPTFTTYLMARRKPVCRSIKIQEKPRETEIFSLVPWLKRLMERINVIPIRELKILWRNASIIDVSILIFSTV